MGEYGSGEVSKIRYKWTSVQVVWVSLPAGIENGDSNVGDRRGRGLDGPTLRNMQMEAISGGI